ncbi:hypothetical protein Tco_0284915 [Tanacetum coccineum]
MLTLKPLLLKIRILSAWKIHQRFSCSNAFKKVVCMFGKFMFFETKESTAMTSGRVCISTRSHYRISKKVIVEVHGELFDVHVHKLGTWSTSITDNSLDTSSNVDVNDIDKVEDVVEEKSIDDLNDLNDNFNDLAQELKEDEVHVDDLNVNFLDQIQVPLKEEIHVPAFSNGGTSDPSHPLGFEHMKRSPSYTSKCSTSFHRHHKNDVKGISLIHELNRIIEVGNTLGFDVRGCRKSLNRLINGIGMHIVDK